jgi:hypothetical protein
MGDQQLREIRAHVPEYSPMGRISFGRLRYFSIRNLYFLAL